MTTSIAFCSHSGCTGSQGTIRGWTRYCMLFLLVLTFPRTGTLASDAYFEKAIGKIEQTLVRPAESYGLVVTDIYVLSSNEALNALGPIKERYGFYTANGKVQSRLENFDPGKPSEQPYFRSLLVSQGEGGETKVADAIRGKNVLGVNVKRSSLSIGQVDIYTYYPTKSKNYARPDKQPFQILANPCFAPLDVTPVQLRKLPVKALADEDGNKVYQVERKENDALMVLRLYFSPEYGDALVRSEEGIAIPNADGVRKYVMRTVRTVEEWQELPSGELVPARFTLLRQRNGETETSMVRVISNPVIGDIDDVMFDTDRLPEFKVAWDDVIDRAVPLEQRVRDKEQRRAEAVAHFSRRSERFMWLVVFNAILLVLVIAFWLGRRLQVGKKGD